MSLELLPLPKSHPLSAAYLRIARAREHLQETIALADEASLLYSAALEQHLGRRVVQVKEIESLLNQPFPQPVISPRLAILAGESAYNLRASLDYLVGQLSRLHTPVWRKAATRRNQFPIEHSPRVFAGRRKTWLAGVSDRHVRRIEAYQPYKGCQWTMQLAALSNTDKHNDIVTLNQAIQFTIKPGAPPLFPEGEFLIAANGLQVEILELPLVPTLENLESQVVQLLDSFKPDF